MKNKISTERRYWHSRISFAKGKGWGPEEYLNDWLQKHKRMAHNSNVVIKPDIRTRTTYEVFKEYNLILRRNNSLDFDDLLIYGVDLVGNHPKTTKWCQHILVDELWVRHRTSVPLSLIKKTIGSQDTNSMQYALMKHIAAPHDHVTIVGDPDQSST